MADPHQLGKGGGDDEVPLPDGRQPPEELVDLEARADVDPGVGSSKMSTRIAEQPLRDHRLLLLPPRDCPPVGSTEGSDVELVDQLLRGRSARPAVEEAGAGDAPRLVMVTLA